MAITGDRMKRVRVCVLLLLMMILERGKAWVFGENDYLRIYGSAFVFQSIGKLESMIKEAEER